MCDPSNFHFKHQASSCRTFSQQADHNLTCIQFRKIDSLHNFLKFLNWDCQGAIVRLRDFDVLRVAW